jgi:hypothetical protein
MSYGMRNGSFTGKKLSDYISGTTADYVNARRIINGTDRAELIAGYATRLEPMLNAVFLSDHALQRTVTSAASRRVVPLSPRPASSGNWDGFRIDPPESAPQQ